MKRLKFLLFLLPALLFAGCRDTGGDQTVTETVQKGDTQPQCKDGKCPFPRTKE